MLIFILFFATATHTTASTNIPLDDEIYHILDRLEAEGIIHSGLLTSRPLSRDEVKRLIFEAERNSVGKGPFIQGLVRSLKERFNDELRDVRFIKPIDNLYLRYIYQDSDAKVFSYNNEGDDYKKGSNLRTGLSSRAELGWISFYMNPEYRDSTDERDLIIKRGYAVLSISGLDLQLGKDSQWWGPGYHGALLVSDNAEALTMLRITNPHPVLLPWVFRNLGPFKFVFFVTRLEEERTIPEPYLWGMRLNFKPIPYIEIGLQRTALLGGKGRSQDLKTWWRSFTGRGENIPGIEAGDQRAGFDIKLNMPFKLQPILLYIEANGEDEAGGLPSKWAYLMGIYLPRVFSFERISLRGEYATTHVKGSPNVWYNHHIYTDGYRYKGRIIGHHMGTDSRDIFLEVSYLIPERNGRISIIYDKEVHNLSERVREKKDEFQLRVDIRLTKGIHLGASYGHGKIEEMKDTINVNTILSSINYIF